MALDNPTPLQMLQTLSYTALHSYLSSQATAPCTDPIHVEVHQHPGLQGFIGFS